MVNREVIARLGVIKRQEAEEGLKSLRLFALSAPHSKQVLRPH